jgi:hypothetical protein
VLDCGWADGRFPNRLRALAVYTSVKEVAMVRVSTVMLAVACLVTGYALLGTRVSAQDGSSVRRLPSGLGVGAHVVLSVPGDPKSVGCTIDRIDGGWVRCAEPENSSGPTFGPRTQVTETWYDIAHIISVQKVTSER